MDDVKPIVNEYRFGDNRYIITIMEGNHCTVTIYEKDVEKNISLSLSAFANLLNAVDEMDVNIPLLREKPEGCDPVKYFRHLGGDVYASINEGVFCVDLRHYYMNKHLNKIMPCKKGFAIRLGEWQAFKEALARICSDTPVFMFAQPCTHTVLDELINCQECTPFGPQDN